MNLLILCSFIDWNIASTLSVNIWTGCVQLQYIFAELTTPERNILPEGCFCDPRGRMTSASGEIYCCNIINFQSAKFPLCDLLYIENL
jgi:hypothetical protein